MNNSPMGWRPVYAVKAKGKRIRKYQQTMKVKALLKRMGW